MKTRRTPTNPDAPTKEPREMSRAIESELARAIASDIPIRQTLTGDPITMETTQVPPLSSPQLGSATSAAPAPAFHHHNGESETIARLLADILTRMRDDPALRPPPLGPKALLAIAQYQVTSAALNPGTSPILNDPIT